MIYNDTQKSLGFIMFASYETVDRYIKSNRCMHWQYLLTKLLAWKNSIFNG